MPKKPSKPNFKKVKIPGATISYAPTKSNENLIESVLASMKEKKAAKEARKAARAATPPDLTPRPCLVAFIDILGFGHEIECAKTKADLERAYEKVRTVQKEFQMESAVDDPEEQAQMNTDYGHRGWLEEDHKDYLDAREKGDHERAQAALNRRALKDAAFFLKWHRKRIEEAYAATGSERARQKYRWLMKYHNRSFRHDVDYVRDEVIDLSKFQPVTGLKGKSHHTK